VKPPVAEETVEAVVRGQLAHALGGRRGMFETAVPTILFTLTFIGTKELEVSLMVSVAAALLLMVVRLVQRSSVQYVLNSLFGIGVGAFFAWRSAQGGGDENDQAMAYFLPGILYNAGYAVVISLSILVRWPVVGFMVGSVAGDPTAWHRDPQVVRLSSHLSWLLVLPCVVRVAVQLPLYLAGTGGQMEPEAAVAALGFSKILMGWPLQLAALAGMVWMLARDRTPVVRTQEEQA